MLVEAILGSGERDGCLVSMEAGVGAAESVLSGLRTKVSLANEELSVVEKVETLKVGSLANYAIRHLSPWIWALLPSL